MELEKHDLSVTQGERTFRIRAYLDHQDPLGGGWHTIIVEHRTPISHDLPITADFESCMNAAVRFVNDSIEADSKRQDVEQDRGGVHAWESEGGASSKDDCRAPISAQPLERGSVAVLGKHTDMNGGIAE